jgi:hypothetical protein
MQEVERERLWSPEGTREVERERLWPPEDA